MYSIKLAFVEFFCTIKNARHFFNLLTGVLLILSTRAIMMEVGIHVLLTASIAIDCFKFNKVSKN